MSRRIAPQISYVRTTYSINYQSKTQIQIQFRIYLYIRIKSIIIDWEYKRDKEKVTKYEHFVLSRIAYYEGYSFVNINTLWLIFKKKNFFFQIIKNLLKESFYKCQ